MSGILGWTETHSRDLEYETSKVHYKDVCGGEVDQKSMVVGNVGHFCRSEFPLLSCCLSLFVSPSLPCSVSPSLCTFIQVFPYHPPVFPASLFFPLPHSCIPPMAAVGCGSDSAPPCPSLPAAHQLPRPSTSHVSNS